MQVLIVGGGGREHALAWKAAQSPLVEQVFVAPGNAGTAREDKVANIPIDATDIELVLGFCLENQIDLVIVGPEAPLVVGLVNTLGEAGIRCFGPTQEAAQLEGSKAFAKSFMQRHKIPTADSGVFIGLEAALEYLDEVGVPVVIKADGLAAGKGVIIAHDMQTAQDAVRGMMSGEDFGAAGRKVVIEEFLEGEEASFIAMADGRHCLPLATSQDHKAVGEGDTGPNTGGMGAYSPAPVVTPEMHDRIMKEVMRPLIDGMAAEGRSYTGFVYAGVMIDKWGKPKVLEFNCRLGDPEAQPLLHRMKTDLVGLCLSAMEGRLDREQIEWDERVALGVVLASGGYPGRYEKGKLIGGLAKIGGEDVKVFHAGTRIKEGQVVTDGGRVICVSALGHTVTQAQAKALARIQRISWDGMFYRRDIGHRAIAREREESEKA